MQAEVILKVVVVGDTGVGKSCLLRRLVDDAYCDTTISTIGVDFQQRTFNLCGKLVKLQLWDTAGQERFQAIGRAYYRGAHAYAIVYSVASASSFYNVRFWASEVRAHGTPYVPVVIVGNKTDLTTSRIVTREMGLAMARELNAGFEEASAKTSAHVERTFMQIADTIYHRSLDGQLARVSTRSDGRVFSADVQLPVRTRSSINVYDRSYYSRARRYGAHAGCC